MKVYIILWDGGSMYSTQVKKVFSTEQLAEDYLQSINRYDRASYWIDEWEVDE